MMILCLLYIDQTTGKKRHEFMNTVKFIEEKLLINSNDYEAKISHRYYDEFIVKMNVDFYINPDPINQSFMLDLISRFRSVQIFQTNFRIVMEFPHNSLRHLIKESPIDEMDDYSASMNSFSIGSVINLCYFTSRFNAIPSQYHPLKMIWNFQKNLIIFYFHIQHNRTSQRYKIEISFSSIQFILLEINQSINTPCGIGVCFELNSAPLLFTEKMCRNRIKWIRTKDLRNNVDSDLIGYAHGYRITIDDLNIIKTTIKLSYLCKERTRTFAFYIGRINQIMLNNSRWTMDRLWNNIDQTFAKSFARNYACRVILRSYRIVDRVICRHGILNEDNVKNFLENIKQLESDLYFENCLYQLDVKSNNPVIDFIAEFNRIVQTVDTNRPQRISIFGSNGKKKLLGPDQDHYIIMRRAIMTPTRLQFFRPIACLRSRFSNIANLDYALRLTLSEDNNRFLNGPSSSSEFIKECIMPRLLAGIRIADRHFEFLGSSSSQMRESGIVFYARDTDNRTAESIRQIVGDLSIFKRKVAKYIARFGLIFSQSIAYYQCDQSVDIYRSADLTNGPFIFSDGGGIISNSLARKITPLLNTPPDYFPSAFQIRYGGCKGMLVRYESSDDNDMIMFRESMIKFQSNDFSLGILKFSAPRSVYLNRPLLQILYEQQVPAHVFYNIITQSTESLAHSLMFEANAYELMNMYSQRNLNYNKLHKAGYSFLNEPFLRRILNHLLFYRLNELKSKARIKVPSSHGRTAFGVIDEMNQLNPGEVFFQYSQLNDVDGLPTGETIILDNQEVMVTKFPCLSLGDVRKFKAINVKGLEHVKDCLVFPAKGHRPHTDEMGGSDLDGDEYAIFWKTDLIFPGSNYHPMDFPSQTSPESDRDIVIDDIVKFYCDFLVDNNIGLVANSHLMFSDFHPEGLSSCECLDLAAKYSVSLDFQKNGVNAKVENKYIPDSNWIRPDFMSKRNGESDVYLSTKILGIIYRHCSLMEDMIRASNTYLMANQENRLEKPNPNLILNCWQLFEQEAMKAYDDYCHLVIDHMEMLDIESEATLISNVFENKSEAATTVLNDLFKHFQKIFELQAQGRSDEERLLLISAWYAICFQRSDHIRYRYHDEPLFGMPFLVPDEMINLIRHVEKSTVANPVICIKIEFEHIELTCMIILFWMAQMNRIFKRGAHLGQLLKIFDRQKNKWYSTTEHQLLKGIIQEQLIIIVDQYQEIAIVEPNEQTHHQVVAFLFDQYLLYLSRLFNQLELLIDNSDLDHVFLLKYSLFAVNFIEKLNRMENPPMNAAILRDKMFEYKLFLKLLIRNFRLETQTCETVEFAILNVDRCLTNGCHRIDFNQKHCLLKLRYMAGNITEIFIHKNNGICIQSLIQSKGKKIATNTTNTNEWRQQQTTPIANNLTRSNVDYFIVKVSGFQTSISLLKCLLGHPKLYPNIMIGYQFI
ncbi:uncharacterized protein LOC124496566 isoform X2 [Dermatophagoides farinae]|uniref:uncharacterized protein LOC124496566 isoform X2 n=1 Tax=Dermatophagoides farinae TaxID=6954 RepID=UPI003F63E67F